MRKRKQEEHLNHEAWAIPYADLMTLLLAFFVVMYAVSVVNEGKYRVMSNSLNQAFNGSSRRIAPPIPTPIKVSAPGIVPVVRPVAVASHVALPESRHLPPAAKAATALSGKGQKDLDNIENQVRRALQPLIDRKLVVLRHKKNWLEIEIRTDILFPSGAARLSSSADAVLQNLAAILARFPNPLRVEGFTDNVPINTSQYPSNWELSAARAASVARLFASGGVASDRLGIVGWGDVRPMADNATVEGRNQNRRVLVVVMNASNTSPRQQSDAGNLGKIAAAGSPPLTRPGAGPSPAQAAPDPDGEGAGTPTASTLMAEQSADSLPAPRPADEPSQNASRRASPGR